MRYTRIFFMSYWTILTTDRRYFPLIFSEHTQRRKYSKTFIASVFWVILSEAYIQSTWYENEYRFKILQTHLLKNLIAPSLPNIWSILAYAFIFHVIGCELSTFTFEKKNCLDHAVFLYYYLCLYQNNLALLNIY